MEKQSQVEILEGSRQALRAGQIHFDFDNEDVVLSALKRVDKAVLITPASPTELETGVRFVQIAKDAGLKHLVFMSIHRVEEAPLIPHFASKVAIQKELEKSGLMWTTVAPNNFYQNDYFFKSSLLDHGIYPQPFGNVGLSRVDADDIADALVQSLLREELRGQIFPLIGPEALTAKQTSEMYSQYLGAPILYGGDDLERWEESNKPYLPAWLLADWKQMYMFFQRQGLKATVADYIQQEKILNRPAKTFESFVKETIQAWKR
ncbi:SDR family oxidoreductase [Bdellovibrio bacteriovorus]|uniref:SDR family oxidoreductase n=1 Tax=Bdellovibrio bacteriovorus TaxID=959 RepID=UPI0035A5CC4C